jgi:formiminotetrahydrofolate cyclodeaminase
VVALPDASNRVGRRTSAVSVRAVACGETPVDEVLAALAAPTPAPASGTAAALTGALAAALAALAAGVSGDDVGVEQANALRARLAGLADDDAVAYADYLRERTPATLARIVEVPSAIAEAAAEVAELGLRLAESGKQSVRGDALAAADLAQGAERAAGRLVALNMQT